VDPFLQTQFSQDEPDPDLPAPTALDDLRAVLTAHLKAEQLKSSRLTALHLLALAGGLCWVLMSWPGVLPPIARTLAALAWPIGVAALLFFIVLEWKWDNRLSRLTKR